jgi:hypothetical protein
VSRLPPFPAQPFALLLVEGGDERAVCEHVAGPSAWAGIVCWYRSGRDDLPGLARLAALDPNFSHARSIGLVLDVEDNLAAATAVAARTLAVFGAASIPTHGVLFAGPPQLGVFLSPDGASHGAIESLCRQAVRNNALAACVDQLVTCAGAPHALVARADKGWLRSYLGMTGDPSLRFHQAFTSPDGIDPAHAAFDGLRAFLRAL